MYEIRYIYIIGRLLQECMFRYSHTCKIENWRLKWVTPQHFQSRAQSAELTFGVYVCASVRVRASMGMCCMESTKKRRDNVRWYFALNRCVVCGVWRVACVCRSRYTKYLLSNMQHICIEWSSLYLTKITGYFINWLVFVSILCHWLYICFSFSLLCVYCVSGCVYRSVRICSLFFPFFSTNVHLCVCVHTLLWATFVLFCF